MDAGLCDSIKKTQILSCLQGATTAEALDVRGIFFSRLHTLLVYFFGRNFLDCGSWRLSKRGSSPGTVFSSLVGSRRIDLML